MEKEDKMYGCFFLFVLIMMIGLVITVKPPDNTVIVTVREYNDTPQKIIPISNLAEEKKNHKYKYLFFAENINANARWWKKYLSEHQKDAIQILSTGAGENELYVFSDNLPDTKYFRTKEGK